MVVVLVVAVVLAVVVIAFGGVAEVAGVVAEGVACLAGAGLLAARLNSILNVVNCFSTSSNPGCA